MNTVGEFCYSSVHMLSSEIKYRILKKNFGQKILTDKQKIIIEFNLILRFFKNSLSQKKKFQEK